MWTHPAFLSREGKTPVTRNMKFTRMVAKIRELNNVMRLRETWQIRSYKRVNMHQGGETSWCPRPVRDQQESPSERIWVSHDLDGESPQRVQRAEQIAGLMGIDPVDWLSFTEHKERLQVRHRSEIKDKGHRSKTQVRIQLEEVKETQQR